jgi:hypothetical protein
MRCIKWRESSGIKGYDDHLLSRVSKDSGNDRTSEAARDGDDKPLTPALI